jgi:hypothetical protein
LSSSPKQCKIPTQRRPAAPKRDLDWSSYYLGLLRAPACSPTHAKRTLRQAAMPGSHPASQPANRRVEQVLTQHRTRSPGRHLLQPIRTLSSTCFQHNTDHCSRQPSVLKTDHRTVCSRQATEQCAQDRPQTKDRPQTTDHRPQATDHRPQAKDQRPQASVRKTERSTAVWLTTSAMLLPEVHRLLQLGRHLTIRHHPALPRPRAPRPHPKRLRNG